jgi:hypothetical protein
LSLTLKNKHKVHAAAVREIAQDAIAFVDQFILDLILIEV